MTKIDFPPEMEVSGSGGKDAGIGGILQAFRVRRGATIEDVAKVLRIRQVYLVAIEEGRYEELPGSIYSLGFVRAYAQYLGLDDDQIVERFKSENENLGSKPSLSFPAMVPDHGIPGGAILMLGLIVVAVGYGGWYFVSSQDSFKPDAVSEVPQELAAKLDDNMAASAGTPGARAVPLEPSAAVAAPNPAPAPALNGTPRGDPPLREAAGETPVGEARPPETSVPMAEKAAPIADTPPAEPGQSVTAPQIALAPKRDKTRPGDGQPGPDTAPSSAAKSAGSAAGTPAAPIPAPQETQSGPADPVPVAASPDMAGTGTVEDRAADQTSVRDGEKLQEQPVASTPVPSAPNQSVDAQTETENEQLASRPEPAVDDEAPVEESAAMANQGAAPESPAPEIIVKAKLDSWVQIRDDNANQLIMTRLMRGGDTYRVPKQSGLTLLTGNAGALEITVDGEVMPPIGGPGDVRRHVTLKADLLRKGTAVIE